MGFGEGALVPNDRAIVNVHSDDAKVWCSGGSWGFLGAFHTFSAIFLQQSRLIRFDKGFMEKNF